MSIVSEQLSKRACVFSVSHKLQLIDGYAVGQHVSTLRLGRMKGNRQVHSLYNHQDLLARYDLFKSLITAQETATTASIGGNPGTALTNASPAVSGRLLEPGGLSGAASSSASVHSASAAAHPVIAQYNHKFCLNFIHIWSTDAAGIMVATPLFLSLAICIAWPVVAVRHYRADVQTSTQTATAVASFLLTASELTGASCIVSSHFED